MVNIYKPCLSRDSNACPSAGSHRSVIKLAYRQGRFYNPPTKKSAAKTQCEMIVMCNVCACH